LAGSRGVRIQRSIKYVERRRNESPATKRMILLQAYEDNQKMNTELFTGLCIEHSPNIESAASVSLTPDRRPRDCVQVRCERVFSFTKDKHHDNNLFIPSTEGTSTAWGAGTTAAGWVH